VSEKKSNTNCAWCRWKYYQCFLSRWSIPSLLVKHTREAILICVAISYDYLSFSNHP